MSSDILTSSLKLAEAFAPVIETPTIEDEETHESTQEATQVTHEEEQPKQEDEEDTEANAIQKALKKNADSKGEKKISLVEDLDEIELEENDQDDFEANLQALEQGEKPSGGSRNSFTKNEEQDEEDDEVNVDEEDEDNKAPLTRQPKISVTIASVTKKKEEMKTENYDFSLLDELFSVID